MKKWIVVIVLLVFVVGGGVAVFVGFKDKNSSNPTADTESKQTSQSAVIPYILAKEKLVLVEGEKSVNTNAVAYDTTNASIQYESLDTNIATVDSLGNVLPLKEGSTLVKNSFVLGNVEYSYDTQIVVLPKDISGTLTLFDENKKETTSVVVGNKYILNYTTETNLENFQTSLFGTDDIQTNGIYDKQGNGFCCEVFFLTQAVHTLGFKLTLKADNVEKDYFTTTLIVDNTEKGSEDEVEQTPQNPDSPVDNPADDPIDDTNDNTEDLGDDPDDNPADDADDNTQNPETPAEPAPTTPTTPSEPDQGEQVQEEMFEIIVGTNKNITIENSTITITNFTKPTDIALSFKPIHSTQKHTMRVEILSGDNLTIELETLLLGLTISATGTTTFRLFSTTNPALSQIFTIVVE